MGDNMRFQTWKDQFYTHFSRNKPNVGDKFVHYPEGWIDQPVLFDTQPDGCLFFYVGGDRVKKEYPQFIK